MNNLIVTQIFAQFRTLCGMTSPAHYWFYDTNNSNKFCNKCCYSAIEIIYHISLSFIINEFPVVRLK